MNKIKTSLVAMALLLLTACNEKEIEYTKLDLKDNQELVQQIVDDYQGNSNPSEVLRKNYKTALQVYVTLVDIGKWKGKKIEF